MTKDMYALLDEVLRSTNVSIYTIKNMQAVCQDRIDSEPDPECAEEEICDMLSIALEQLCEVRTTLESVRDTNPDYENEALLYNPYEGEGDDE
jgi:hypothetical protein